LPISKDAIPDVIGEIFADLADNGLIITNDIKRNIGNISITRLDLYKNVKPNYPVEDYLELFRDLSPKRLRPAHYQKTLKWKNTQWEITLYNKKKQLFEKHNIIIKDIEHLARLELRFKTGQKIFNVLGFRKLKDLIAIEEQILDNKFNQQVQKLLFNNYQYTSNIHSVQKCTYSFKEKLMNMFYDLVTLGPTNLSQHFQQDAGMLALVSNFETYEIRELLRDHFTSRATFSRFLNKFEDFKQLQNKEVENPLAKEFVSKLG